MGIADLSPFYQMLAPGLRPVCRRPFTVAAIIASQALITGAFSLVSEMLRLVPMPHMQVFYPAGQGQLLYSHNGQQRHQLANVKCSGAAVRKPPA